jgi:hypothetical protein
MAYETENILSKFNAGMFQTERIHTLQSRLNDCNANLSAFNGDFNCWNFELAFKTLCSLFSEVYPKLLIEEKNLGINFIESLDDNAKKFLILEQDENKNKLQLNDKNFKSYCKILFRFELMIKDYLDNHGLNNPNKDDLEGL